MVINFSREGEQDALDELRDRVKASTGGDKYDSLVGKGLKMILSFNEDDGVIGTGRRETLLFSLWLRYKEKAHQSVPPETQKPGFKWAFEFGCRRGGQCGTEWKEYNLFMSQIPMPWINRKYHPFTQKWKARGFRKSGIGGVWFGLPYGRHDEQWSGKSSSYRFLILERPRHEREENGWTNLRTSYHHAGSNHLMLFNWVPWDFHSLMVWL